MNAVATIRLAEPADTPAVVELCRRMQPSDYVVDAWPGWLRPDRDVNLVAEHDGRIVACLHATFETPAAVFGQALRVDPEYRHVGLGSRLTRHLLTLLRARGAKSFLGVTGADNIAARRFWSAMGMHEILQVARRSHPAWRGGERGGVRPSPLTVMGSPALLASRPGLAVYRRIYFRATESWLRERQELGLLFAAPNGAFVVLDSSNAPNDLWVGTLAATESELPSLLARVGIPGEPARLTIEAPATAGMQRMLTAAGFAAAAPDGSYVVVEMTL